MSEDQLEMLLVEWEVARQKGQDLTAEQVIEVSGQADVSGKTIMVDQLRERIEALKATSWMMRDAATDGDNANGRSDVALADSNVLASGTAPPSPSGSSTLNTFLRPTTTNQFLDAIVRSGVLDDGQVRWLKELAAQYDPGITPREMADRLIEEKLLTSYQASVLLSGKQSPLVLDRYTILDTLGAGGMGVVYKALHRAMERVVAIKVLPRHAVDSPHKVKRFQREIKATARLKHPNIVVAYDAHQSDGNCFLVMEHVEGDDLKKTVLMNGPLGVSDAVTLMVQIASALGAAHSIDIIHRDVKPSNILLSNEGVPKLLDLGLARAKEVTRQESTNQLTREGLAMGTAAYMAPEQARNPRNADVRSDIYSLGCTLYYLIVGKPMFDKDSSLETILAHMEETAPSLKDGCKDVPGDLEKVYQRMIAKEPSERYANMSEVRAALMATGLVDPEQVAESARYQVQQPVYSLRCGLRGALLGIAAVLLLGAGVLLVMSRMRSDEDLQRDYAIWAIQSGGTVITETSLAGEQTFSSTETLPSKPFQVIGIALRGNEENGDGNRVDGKLASLDTMLENPALQQISLSGFAFEQLPLSELVHLSDLSTLGLISCGLRDEHMQSLAALKQLRLLDLSGNEELTDAALDTIRQLEHLEELNLAGIPMSDYGLTLLAEMSNLRQLNLSNTEVTPSGIAKFSKNLPNCLITFDGDSSR